MIELYLLFTLLIIILFSLNVNHRIRKKKLKTIQLAKIVLCLRSLLECLARHRGMTNAYLKGDHSFKPEISQLQKDIDRLFNQLTDTNEIIHENITDYRAMKLSWDQLKSNVLDRQPTENFKLHVTLIEKVIEYIAEEGLFIEVALSDNPNAKIIANTLVTEIPYYVETLGQARGIATGAIAQGGCTVDVKMNLKYLYEELESMSNNLNSLKSINTSRLSNNLDMTSLVGNSVSSINAFSALLKTNIIDMKTPDVSTEVLYKQGTEAITNSLAMFDTLYPLCLKRINISI